MYVIDKNKKIKYLRTNSETNVQKPLCENYETWPKEIQKDPMKWSDNTIFMHWKTHQGEDVSSPQIHLQIQHNPNHNPRGFLQKLTSSFETYMEMQRPRSAKKLR